MSKVVTRACPELFLTEVRGPQVIFGAEDYAIRQKALLERMREKGRTHAVIFGDREHFATMHYFSGYDCRFEEAIMVLAATGEVSMIVGNEGISQTYPIPFPTSVYLYQNFSLQGQPRNKQKQLPEILRQIGLCKDSRVGVIGYKFFTEDAIDTDPNHTFDIPAYVLGALAHTSGAENLYNDTAMATGHPDGVRLRLRTAKEIAWAEAAGNQSAGVVTRMLKKLKPGLTERELSMGVAEQEPLSVHTMINFGAEKVRIGVTSPSDRALKLGEVCGLCYAVRGSLTSRVGVAAYDESTVSQELRGHLGFYRELWHTVAEVLGMLRVGARCADIHNAAYRRIGAPEYGLSLNVTHDTGADEWVNSPVYQDSPLEIQDGAHIQIDIIASNGSPVRTAICEDSVVIAGKALRDALAKEYPEVYARIKARQEAIRAHLGIALCDDVLPMSNLTGAFFPYMLNLSEVFAVERED